MDGLDSKSQLREFVQNVIDAHPLASALRTLQSGAVVLAIPGTQHKLAFGTVPITWSASAAASATITHGLGVTPVWHDTQLLLAGQVAYLQSLAVGGTTISVNGQAAAAWSGSGTIYWAAIG